MSYFPFLSFFSFFCFYTDICFSPVSRVPLSAHPFSAIFIPFFPFSYYPSIPFSSRLPALPLLNAYFLSFTLNLHFPAHATQLSPPPHIYLYCNSFSACNIRPNRLNITNCIRFFFLFSFFWDYLCVQVIFFKASLNDSPYFRRRSLGRSPVQKSTGFSHRVSLSPTPHVAHSEARMRFPEYLRVISLCLPPQPAPRIITVCLLSLPSNSGLCSTTFSPLLHIP